MPVVDDKDFAALLERASRPVPPPDALARLMARVEPKIAATVIPFRKPARPPLWPAAALLAASLAAGIYLGAAGFTDQFYGDTASLDDPVDLIGVDGLDGDAT